MATLIIMAAAAGCLLVAGFYLAFAATVMPALLGDAHTGVPVMRSINRWAVRPPFMILFFGTAILCAVVSVQGFLNAEPAAVGGSLAYLAGVASTVAGNVRLNEQLARAGDDDSGWSQFAGPWSRLNLFRLVASAVGGALLLVHLVP